MASHGNGIIVQIIPPIINLAKPNKAAIIFDPFYFISGNGQAARISVPPDELKSELKKFDEM